MERFFRIIAVLLLVSFVSCTSAPYTINGVLVAGGSQPPRLKLMQAGGTSRSSTQTPQQAAPQAQAAASASPYWTGDGGKGKSITILPPRSSGLAQNQSYLPDFVANELVSNFNAFSAMTLFDRVNNQKQYDELLSGYYSDDDKAGQDLGHLASTDYMLLGTITKTSTGYALQLTINRNSDKTTAASYSGTVTIAELDNMIGVRRASADLLQKMGVQLTAQARAELAKAPETDQLNALTAMAQGIIAQRQGTDVAALTYFLQAASFDASLAEAVSRTNVLSANIATGNIGANVRNDIAWFDSWKDKLSETETYLNDMLKNNSPQRSVWYSSDIREEESARDYNKRTTELRTDAVLHTQAALPVSVQRTVQAVYDGLQSTKRAQAWKLDGWPRYGVTNNNPFTNRWGGSFQIAFEVLNTKGKVIGRQTVDMDSRYSFSGTRLDGPGTAFATVRFTGVSASDIDDTMSIRIASINGNPPEKAGISQIAPMSDEQMKANKSYTIYNGAIRPNSNERNLGAVTIPAEVWGERVNAIADGAFENRGLTGITLPNSVTSIGANAFANNELESTKWGNSVIFIGNRAFYNAYSKKSSWKITIHNSVISIGNEAYANNTISSVILGDRVTTIGDKAFAGNHWARDGLQYGLSSITIPASVTSIGQEAFVNHWTTQHYYEGQSWTTDHWSVEIVTIGANIDIGENTVGNGFEEFYTSTGKRAGIYADDPKYGGFQWAYFTPEEWQATVEKTKKSEAFWSSPGGLILQVIGLAALAAGGIYLLYFLAPAEEAKDK